MLVTRAAPGSIKSAERALDILEALADGDSRQPSLSELGRQLGIPKSSLHGLVRVLVRRGYLDFNITSRTYRLGPRVLGLANTYLAGFDLHQAARPIMATLARLTGETITLDIPQGASMITIAREVGQQPVRVVTQLGIPFASHATASGKAYLASLPEEEFAALFPDPVLPRITASTIPTVAKLREELVAIRRSGVAHAHGEINDGVEAIAVPIVGHRHELVAVLDALVPQHRAETAHLQRIEVVLRAGAAVASSRLGGPSTLANLVVEVESHLEEIWGTNGKGAT